MSGWSARGSSRCGSLHHHSTQYSSRQRTKQGSPPSRRRELPARTTPRSGFRRWRPAGPMPLPVRRPANAIASIAVRRRQLVSGSSIRRPRHPLGRANRHAPSRSCSGRGSERARGPAWRRASAPLRRRSRGCSGDGPAHSSPECCSLRCSVRGSLPQVTAARNRRILARSHAPPMPTRQRVGQPAPGGLPAPAHSSIARATSRPLPDAQRRSGAQAKRGAGGPRCSSSRPSVRGERPASDCGGAVRQRPVRLPRAVTETSNENRQHTT